MASADRPERPGSQSSSSQDASSQQDKPSSSNADLAQAYRDLTRGEQAATALEASLDKMESKLNALLDAFENPPASTAPSDTAISGSGAQPQGNPPVAKDKAQAQPGTKDDE